MKQLWLVGWGLLILFVFAACQQDEEPLPAYRQELVDISTTSEGVAEYIRLDDGSCRPLTKPMTGLPGDTLLRGIALYVEEGHPIHLYQFKSIFSQRPQQVPLEKKVFDPIDVKSVWRPNANYINFLLTRKTGGGSQALVFADEGISTLPSGRKKWVIELCHAQGQDPLYYSADSYVSCSTAHYVDSLQSGVDSIAIKFHTFQGLYTVTFAF